MDVAQYLENVRLAALWFPAAAALLFLPIWALHRRWYGELHEYRLTISALFIFYLMAAGLFTVLPLPITTPEFCARMAKASHLELTPFGSFAAIPRFANEHGLGWGPGDLVRNWAFMQIALNFLLLLPFGTFVRALFRTSFIETLALAFLVSLLFELTQVTGLWGFSDCPYRVFDVDDLIINTTGAGIGWLLWNVFFYVVPDPSAPEHEMWYRRGKTPPGSGGPQGS
ncbi:MAG: VanZ family protein [Hyphomicrobium sp.]|uniref:VanZ family protein n=1 Tax=Hyphomicrobium sp. TaxID=82 RepID=UPI003D0998B0